MPETTLFNLIVKSAYTALKGQRDDGSLAPGHNGPYNDLETPVRNTGHWLMIFKKAFEISNDPKLKDAAYACLKYLTSEHARPMKATFWHRCKPEKDFTNGLVGQAWTIEALISAYELFGERSILRTAEDVFNLHPYSVQSKGWEIVNVDGSIRGFDRAFNHQLWFAAAGALLSKALGKTDINGVQDFVHHLDRSIGFYKDGVVKHLPTFYLRPRIGDKIMGYGSVVKRLIQRKSKYIYMKSVGYHGFNLYAIALIHNAWPETNLLNHPALTRALSVTDAPSFRNNLARSKYAYPYNPAGLELSFVFDSLRDEERKTYWLQEQFDKTFDFSQNLMCLGGTTDELTSSARLYEAVRISDTVISY